MTAIKTAFYPPLCKHLTSTTIPVEKKKKESAKESHKLSFIILLLIFGNIIAIAISADFSFGLFGSFLLGITGISFLGTLFGKIIRN